MKRSRGWGFAVVAVGYALAALTGVAVWRVLDAGPVWRVLWADVAATLVVYMLSLLFGNASFYDPYWSVQPVVILTALAAVQPASAGTYLLLAVVWCWGVRLTCNWAYTFHGLGAQDWRYTLLKEKSGKLFFLVNLFGIQLFPTLIVFLCCLPAIRSIELGGGYNATTLVLAAACVAAVMLQLVADVQMQRFRRAGTGGLIRTGLWKHARHPNYLGEIVMWWGVYGMAVSMHPSLWPLFAGALCNTLMFVCISIPLAEHRLAACKEGFAQYRSQTRMLLPIPR